MSPPPKVQLPSAGKTANELASAGAAALSADWQTGHSEALAYQEMNAAEVQMRMRRIDADRPAVRRAFAEHVAALAVQTVGWPQMGAWGGAACGGAYGFFEGMKARRESQRRSRRLPTAQDSPHGRARLDSADLDDEVDTSPWALIFTWVGGGMAGGGVVGFVAGVVAHHMLGPRRPRVSGALPPEVESRLARALGEFKVVDGNVELVPGWRAQGWAEIWTALVRDYISQGPSSAEMAALAATVAPALVRTVLH